MNLPLLESSFQLYVLGGDEVLGRDEAIVAEIAGPDDRFREARLAIYRDAYRLRLVEVLESDYPALKAHLGEAFEGIAREYLAAHPSTFRNVRWFGGRLAGFLRAHPRHCANPVLADLAEFEWTLGLAFDAADAPSVTFDEVATVAPEHWPGLRFSAHPSLHVRKLHTAAVGLWKAALSEPASPRDENGAVVEWAIWRKNLAPHFRSMPADETQALAATRAGNSFADICAGLCNWVGPEQAATRAAQLLRGWVDEGWIGALSLP